MTTTQLQTAFILTIYSFWTRITTVKLRVVSLASMIYLKILVTTKRLPQAWSSWKQQLQGLAGLLTPLKGLQEPLIASAYSAALIGVMEKKTLYLIHFSQLTVDHSSLL